ncbi:MAG: FecR family protein [Gammaproteobacteria bacterium]|nr:FecR family protein [Gammaproteobacteria bacterium]
MLSLLAFALLLCWAQALSAAQTDPAGRVTIKLGTVEAIAADGTVRSLGRQDPVFEGDTLRTGSRGRAQIRFTDQGVLSLRPDTELAIDDYEFDRASPSSGSQEMSLARGGFRTRTGSIAEDNRDAYRVRTPLAVIGVRGTVWEAFQEVGGPPDPGRRPRSHPCGQQQRSGCRARREPGLRLRPGRPGRQHRVPGGAARRAGFLPRSGSALR